MVNSVEISEYHDPKEIITIIKTKDADDHSTPNGKTKITIASEIGNGLFIAVTAIMQSYRLNSFLFQIYSKSYKRIHGMPACMQNIHYNNSLAITR